MTFIQEIESYIESNQLFDHQSKLLIAVSGGVDSMVLLDSLRILGYNLQVAHCQFQLREEAFKEKELIEQYCTQNNLVLHQQSFDTKDYCENNKLSIQEGARKLRYDWFEKIIDEHNMDFILLGHHLEDQLENLLMGVTRGSGLNGISGMIANSGNKRRPLLNTSKDTIYSYAKENSIPFIEDQSNTDNKYLRNAIRNKIAPIFKEISKEHYPENLKNTFNFLQSYQRLATEYIDQFKRKYCVISDEELTINKEDLMKEKEVTTIVYELLLPYGFSGSICKNISKSLSKNGLTFNSSTHKLFIERESIHVQLNKEQIEFKTIQIQSIEELTATQTLPFHFRVNTEISSGLNIDLKQLSFPIQIRSRNEGDRFQVFGLKGKSKAVKEYLTDKKVNTFEKRNVLILEDQKGIVAILGHEIAYPYRLTETTDSILNIQYD